MIGYALAEWLADIRRTQLPGILGGVGPVHSFVQLFQGLVDLVRLPIDQYRKDGRVMLGLQRGANAFTTSSAMAFLELANRGVQLVQVRGRFVGLGGGGGGGSFQVSGNVPPLPWARSGVGAGLGLGLGLGLWQGWVDMSPESWSDPGAKWW